MFREFSQNSDAPVTRFENAQDQSGLLFWCGRVRNYHSILYWYWWNQSGEESLSNGDQPAAPHIDSLLKTELLIFDDAHKEASQLLDTIEEMEPSNQEVYIQKAAIFKKQTTSISHFLIQD